MFAIPFGWKVFSLLLVLICSVFAGLVWAQTYPGSYPQKEISNGILRAKIYLPDEQHGFYRGMRFDWAGVIGALEYNGHTYFGPFFEKFDPAVSDVVIGNPVEAGVASAASGPVEEFISHPDGTVLGYEEAKPGDPFCKIGVGSLRKIDQAPYSSYTNYPILNIGKRAMKSGGDWIEFSQAVDCGAGYGYSYTKTVRFAKNEPVMTIEHHLVNTGQKTIETQVYDHNFLTIDHQSTSPDVSIRFAFTPKVTQSLAGLAEIRGNELVFTKEFKGSDTFYTEISGFGDSAADYRINVENRKTGAGVEINGDRPLANVGVWAVRAVVAPEPYIKIRIPAGQEFRWKYTYRFYVGSGSKPAK